MVADAEIAVSTTKLMAGTDAAPFLSYLRRLVSLNVEAVTIALLARGRLERSCSAAHATREVVGIRSGFHDPRIPLEAVDDERAGLWKTSSSPLIGQ
jgi:hypothetical protein